MRAQASFYFLHAIRIENRKRHGTQIFCSVSTCIKPMSYYTLSFLTFLLSLFLSFFLFLFLSFYFFLFLYPALFLSLLTLISCFFLTLTCLCLLAYLALILFLTRPLHGLFFLLASKVSKMLFIILFSLSCSLSISRFLSHCWKSYIPHWFFIYYVSAYRIPYCQSNGNKSSCHIIIETEIFICLCTYQDWIKKLLWFLSKYYN